MTNNPYIVRSFCFKAILKAFLIAGLANCLPVNSASAQIIFSTPQAFASGSGDSPIITSGSLVYAVGIRLTSTVTVNDGISFVPAGNNVTVSGGLSTVGGLLLPSTTGDANFNTVLNTGYFASGPITLTLNKLTIGQQYEVQYFLTDTRTFAGVNGRTFEVLSGSPGTGAFSFAQSFQYAYVTGGASNDIGAYVTGVFTATAGTQSLEVQGWDSDGTAIGGQIQAFVLETVAVPEPSVVAGFGLGMLILGGASLKRKLQRIGLA